MTPGRVRALALLAAVTLLLGAIALRAQLRAGLHDDLLPLTVPPIARPQPSPTGTPAVRVRLATVGPTATGTPKPQPQASPPASQPTVPPWRLWLPLAGGGQSEPPFPPSAQLTPEVQQTPTPAATPVPPAAPAPTQAPAPTPAPTATRCPMRETKLGIGLYDSGGAFLPILDQIRPSVILLMDPTVDFAQEVRRAFPRAFVVGRIYDKDQPLDNPSQRGAAFADRVAQLAVPLKAPLPGGDRPVVDAWMSYNEITGHKDVNNFRAYNAFQVAFARRLQGDYGIPAVAGNDGVGTVEPQEYAQYFREAITTSQYFGIHAYAPYGETSMRSPRSHDLVLRYRQIYKALTDAGIPVRDNQLIITEAGLWDGWRGVASEDSMAQDFTWFADELNKDRYVRGAAVFGLFVSDRWQSFNIAGTSIIQRIGDYNSDCRR